MSPSIVLGILPYYVLQAKDCCRHCACLQEANKTFAFHSYVLMMDYIFAYENKFFLIRKEGVRARVLKCAGVVAY